MSTNKEPIAPIVVVMIPKSTKDLVPFARNILNAMQDNPNFANPPISLTVFSADINALADAQMNAATRAKGAAQLRDAKKKRVKDDIYHLGDYVQSVVETDMTPAAAVAVIHSAFMRARSRPKRAIPELSAKNAEVSGKVALVAKAAGRVATYYWEYSRDQSTWTPVPDTLKARTEISGLTSLSVYYFRFRALTRAGQQDYSQVVSLVVH